MAERMCRQTHTLAHVYDDCKNTLNITRLAAFDFDYTIIAKNSDTIIRDLLPREKIPSDEDMPKNNWTQYMANIFVLLNEHGVTPQQICDTIRQIPEVPGMIKLIKTLKNRHNFDTIIISDANSIFINEWIKCNQLQNDICGIYTNPGVFDQNGLLQLSPYHHQTECKMSAQNLCKGMILEEHIVNAKNHCNKRYQNILYIGDGLNDICPATRLRACDIACARAGFGMERGLEHKRANNRLLASILRWNDGFDLLTKLELLYNLPKTTFYCDK